MVAIVSAKVRPVPLRIQPRICQILMVPKPPIQIINIIRKAKRESTSKLERERETKEKTQEMGEVSSKEKRLN